jgi:hypothetical protein
MANTRNYTKWTWNMPTSSTSRPSRMYPNLDFWFENIPSGNPASFRLHTPNPKRAGWSDRTNFRLLVNCLIWVILRKLQKLGYFFPRYKLCFKIGKTWIGLRLGRFSHNLIWSHWKRVWNLLFPWKSLFFMDGGALTVTRCIARHLESKVLHCRCNWSCKRLKDQKVYGPL